MNTNLLLRMYVGVKHGIFRLTNMTHLSLVNRDMMSI